MVKKKLVIITGIVGIIGFLLVIYVMAFAPFLWNSFYVDCHSIKKGTTRDSVEKAMQSYIQDDNYDKVIDGDKIYIYRKGLFSHQCRIDFENGEVIKIIPVFD